MAPFESDDDITLRRLFPQGFSSRVAVHVASITGTASELDELGRCALDAGYQTRRCAICGRPALKLYAEPVGSVSRPGKLVLHVALGGIANRKTEVVTATALVERAESPAGTWALVYDSATFDTFGSYELYVNTSCDADAMLLAMTNSLNLPVGKLTVRFPAGWENWGAV